MKHAESQASVDHAEIAKFAALADSWWDPAGPYRQLHLLNPVRLAFVRDRLCAHLGRDPLALQPLKGLFLVDIGCGGGILTEPLARMGADVLGIDVSNVLRWSQPNRFVEELVRRAGATSAVGLA